VKPSPSGSGPIAAKGGYCSQSIAAGPQIDLKPNRRASLSATAAPGPRLDQQMVVRESLGRIDAPACPDIPRWKISVSPRSVSISPYLARRPSAVTIAPVSRWRRSTGIALRRSARRGSTCGQALAGEHGGQPANGGFDFGKLWHAAKAR
jgi:hypothetical protein